MLQGPVNPVFNRCVCLSPWVKGARQADQTPPGRLDNVVPAYSGPRNDPRRANWGPGELVAGQFAETLSRRYRLSQCFPGKNVGHGGANSTSTFHIPLNLRLYKLSQGRDFPKLARNNPYLSSQRLNYNVITAIDRDMLNAITGASHAVPAGVNRAKVG